MSQQPTNKPNALAASPIPAYRHSSWTILHIVNPLTRLAVGKLGLDDHNGTWVLEVKGRSSGRWHATPVRLLDMDGLRYLVAPQGETDWVRNLRVQGSGRLRMGEHVRPFRAVEVTGDAKLPILRAYFTRWWSLAAPLTTVASANAPDEEYIRAAPAHPVFRLE